MLLTITDPLGKKEEHALDNQGLCLGAVFRDHLDDVGGCLINGRLSNDWQSFVPVQGDQVEIISKVGGPFAGLIISLIMMVINILMSVLAPKPKKPKGNAKRAEAFGIGGFNNTTGAGLPKFIIYGQNRILGHVIGSNARLSPDGRQMYGRVLYFMGDTGEDGYESITDVKIDDTDSTQYEEVKIETRLGTAGQAVIPEFENVDSLFTDGRQLDFDRDTATGTPIIYTTRGIAIQRATLFFSLPSGLYRINKKGRTRAAGVRFRIETKKNSDPTFVLLEDTAFGGTLQSAVFKTYEINFPSAEKWDIRITKTGEDAFVENEIWFGDMLLFNVQETVFTTRNYPGSALLAVLDIPARKVRSLEGMRVSALVKGKKVKVWDGANDTVEFTRRRCWIVRDMMTHPLIGMGNEINDDEIDRDQWLESQGYYEELVTGHDGTEIRDLCDVVINESQWDWEWIKGVAGEVRGRIIPSGDKWRYVIEKPDTPKLLYAEPGNIIEGSLIAEISQLDRSFNQVIAEFRDETNDYKPDVPPPITDTDIGSDPIVQESRRYDTIVRESQVQRENMIVLKREKLEKRRFSFTSPKGAIVSEPMDIDYLSERAIGNQGAFTGFLPAGSTISTVILPYPCKLEAAETYAIIVRHRGDNTIEYKTVTTPSGTVASITISGTFVQAPDEGDLFALGIENFEHILTRAHEMTIDDQGRVKQIRSEYIPAVFTPDALPPKQDRRRFRLGDHPPPLPLIDAKVREEIVTNKDGSIRSMLVFDVTPGLLEHSGTAQGGNTNFITLAAIEPTIDDYYNTAVLRIVEGTGLGQERKIVDYVGASLQAFPESPFSPAPDVTSVYEIEWTRLAEFGGFKVEIRDDPAFDWSELCRAYGTHWELDGRGSGPGTEYFRFTPFSVGGVDNTNGRWIRSLVLVGDLSAPAQPVSITLAAYLKTVSAMVTFNRPMAEDFSSVEIEFWRGSLDSGVLLQTTRYGAAPDTADTGTMKIEASSTFPDESYGAVIWARARSVDRSNNFSVPTDATAGVTLTLPSDIGPDTEAPAVPTGLTLNTGVQPDPVTGLPVVFLDISWDPNTEPDISAYEVQYRQVGAPSFTARMVFHPEVSTRELGVTGNVAYEARVQALDTSVNKSGFTAFETITTAKDTTPPAPPTSPSTLSGFKQIVIIFTPPVDIDFAAVEVWRSQTNDRATAVYRGDALKGAISYTDSVDGNDLTVYYWLRSKDYSGNPSAFTPGDTAGVVGQTLRIDADDVIVTSALITQAAQIASAIIGNAHINSLSADKITAGILQAFYSIGVGGGTNGSLFLDGVQKNIVTYDQQPRARVVLGRVGPAATDYGLQIYGSDGSLWMSVTEGLNTAGLSPNAASQVSFFDNGAAIQTDGSSPQRVLLGQVSLLSVGGPVLVQARLFIQALQQGAFTNFVEIWRDSIGGINIDSLPYSLEDFASGAPINCWGVDIPLPGLHTWYFTNYAPGLPNMLLSTRRLQALETKR